MKKATLLLLLMFQFTVSCQNKIKNVTVDIDAGVKINQLNSLSGFLHYTDVRALDKDIKELKPKYWRIGWSYKSMADIDYLISNGITPIMVLSDKYGYPSEENKSWRSPLVASQFQTLVKNLYKELGNKVIYDIWNEPYHEVFGNFKHEDFYGIFKQAHDAIRSQPGGENALITGPSFDRYDRNDIENFLKYCQNNKIRVDVLSWHDWRSGDQVGMMKRDIEDVKNNLLPKYQSVGVKKIVLGEIISSEIQFSPSEVLNVFKSLEESGIDGACKGCWGESDGIFNCNNNSMDGLLDRQGKPRSVWWAYKLYTQSLDSRIKAESGNDNLIPFVSQSQDKIFIVLANNSKSTITTLTLKIRNLQKINSFKTAKNMNIQVYEIPDTHEAALAEPKFISSKVLKINSNNMVRFDLKKLDPKKVYYLALSKK